MVREAMRRLLAPVPLAVLLMLGALLVLLAYGLAENEPDRDVERALGAGERNPAPLLELPRLSGVGAETLDGLQGPGGGAQLLGLLV